MIIKNIPEAKKILEKKNYYNLINGTKTFYLIDNNSELYKNGISFKEVDSIATFDYELRMLFIKYILVIESEFRSRLAYEFSKSEGPYSWDNQNSFDCNSLNNIRLVTNLITKLQNVLNRNNNDSQEDMINHFINLGEKVPLWALINTFDFGTLKCFYLNAKQNLKRTIALNYYRINIRQLISFLETLNMFRNVCAHDYRVIFYRIHDLNKQISDMPVHQEMHIKQDSNVRYQKGKNDLFAIVIIFKYMLSKNDFKIFMKSLKKIIKALKKKLKVVQIDDIYDSIGFPVKNDIQCSWDDILKVK